MVQYKKARVICLLQYDLMLLLHNIYGFFYCTQEQFLKTLAWSVGILLFIGICMSIPGRSERIVTGITFVSVIISSYYIGVVLHTLAFAMLMYLVTELIVSLYLNWHYTVFFGVLSTLAEISFMVFFPDILLETVPSLFLYGCYIVCYILGVANMCFLVSSARKYLEQMHIKAREAQEAALHKSQFLANISHEIRTPMNVICGMTQMLIREEMSEKAREYAENINRASAVLLSLVNDILDLSKINSGKFEIHIQKYNLIRLIDDVSNLMSVRIDPEKVRFEVETEQGLPEFLLGDSDRIKQVLINILNNAVKFTAKGEIRFRISSTATETPDKVRVLFEVSDTGIGIKQEDIGDLFDSFKRFDEKNHLHIEGTGLGLNICDHLVRRMDGQITVESVYGEGSVFQVMIPQMVADGLGIGNDAEKAGESWKAPDACILVVDDTKTNYLVIKNLLSLFQIQSDYAESGMQAIQKMEEKKYDLILLDHMMPEMDGEETLRRIKDQAGEHFDMIPVIAVTANAAVGGREEFQKLGFSDYLSKPIELEQLDAVLRTYLHK